MLVIDDAKLAQYGIVTRGAKGSELTHEEVDNNMAIALDVMEFDNVSWDSSKEYPALVSATQVVESDGAVTISSINGYCAIDVSPLENIGKVFIIGIVGEGRIDKIYCYSNGVLNSNILMEFDNSILDGTSYIMVASSNDITFEIITGIVGER